jgi:hypothetical protein
MPLAHDIKTLKEQEPETWLELVREHCGIGRSRAYEYVSIAEGKKTAEESRAKNAEANRRYRESPSRDG